MGDEFLMEAAGADDIDEAIRVLRRGIHEEDDETVTEHQGHTDADDSQPQEKQQ